MSLIFRNAGGICAQRALNRLLERACILEGLSKTMIAYRKRFVFSSMRGRYLTAFALSSKEKASAQFANLIFSQNSQTGTMSN